LKAAAVATLTFCRISKQLPQYVMLCTPFFYHILFFWPWYFIASFLFWLAFSVFGYSVVFFSPAGNKYFIRRGVKGVPNLHHHQVSLGPA